jgi:hypothetical protein
MINPSLLTAALHELQFTPEIDLFASRLNKQFERYVSYKPDPQAEAIDAFTLNWTSQNFYAFPPFSVMPRMLQKIVTDEATGICVLPEWTAQSWFPQAMHLCRKPPIPLKPCQDLLTLPGSPRKLHPLHKKLRLLVCYLSGKN